MAKQGSARAARDALVPLVLLADVLKLVPTLLPSPRALLAGAPLTILLLDDSADRRAHALVVGLDCLLMLGQQTAERLNVLHCPLVLTTCGLPHEAIAFRAFLVRDGSPEQHAAVLIERRGVAALAGAFEEAKRLLLVGFGCNPMEVEHPTEVLRRGDAVLCGFLKGAQGLRGVPLCGGSIEIGKPELEANECFLRPRRQVCGDGARRCPPPCGAKGSRRGLRMGRSRLEKERLNCVGGGACDPESTKGGEGSSSAMSMVANIFRTIKRNQITPHDYVWSGV